MPFRGTGRKLVMSALSFALMSINVASAATVVSTGTDSSEFGQVEIGQEAKRSFEFTASGADIFVPLDWAVFGVLPPFITSDISCEATLVCAFDVTFAPTDLLERGEGVDVVFSYFDFLGDRQSEELRVEFFGKGIPTQVVPVSPTLPMLVAGLCGFAGLYLRRRRLYGAV
ncbi:MAG: hypothetical protein AAGK37_22890 [Pseudomonadota bacterium]